MSTWRRRIRGAFLMGLTWAAGWAFIGFVLEAIDNLVPGLPIVSDGDIWPMVLGIPGFIAGAAFSIVLGVAAGNRKFDELSLPRFTAWGAVGGLLLGGLLVALRVSNAGPPEAWWQVALVLGPPTLLSALSACATLALARRARERALPRGGDDQGLLED